MKVKVEALDQHKVSLHIEVEAEAVAKGFKQAVSRISNRVNVPGFRKGKAPRKTLEMRFGKAIVAAEAQDIVINKAMNEALAENKLVPVTQPDIKADVFSEKEGATFTATFVKQPEVKLGEYKGLEVEKHDVKITDEQVEEQLKMAAQQSARLKVVPEGSAVEKGDYVFIDFKGTVDGKPFEGGEGKGYPLEIGSNSFIPGFEDQLKGHKAGDDVTVKVKFPKPYFKAELENKDAEFAVHINDVKRKEVPELNDEFAKSVGKFETIKDLRDSLKQQMQLQAVQQAEDMYRQALVEKAVANSEVDIPKEMIDQRIDEIISEMKLNMQARNLDFDTYLKNVNKTEEEFRKQYEENAAKEVRQSLILGAIADKEKLTVTDNDLSMEVYFMAQQFNAEPKDVVNIIKEENRVGMLVDNVRRKKAAAFIFGEAKKDEVKEVKEEKKEKAESNLASKTVKELKAYAEEKGIALDSRAKKAEIIAAIEAAEAK